MYLMYVDESGDLTNPDKEHVVLGGFAIHENDVRRLAREVEAVVARHLDPHLRHLELHAQHIRKGKGGWRGVPNAVKVELLRDVGGLLATFPANHPFGLFAVVRRPGAIARAEPLERIYEELAMRFNSWIRKNRVGDVAQHGMFICDEAKYEKIVQPLVRDWQAGDGSRIGRLTRIIEVPLFVDSAASRLIQAADFVAHAVYLDYEGGDRSHLEPLLPAFARRANGYLDGFVHLTPEFEQCECLPCTDRRDMGEQLELPEDGADAD